MEWLCSLNLEYIYNSVVDTNKFLKLNKFYYIYLYYSYSACAVKLCKLHNVIVVKVTQVGQLSLNASVLFIIYSINFRCAVDEICQS